MALFEEGLIKAACADGDPQAIADLCENIRVALRDRPELGYSPVRIGGGLGDSDADNFAYRMLRACERASIPPPKGLVDLFQVLFEQERQPAGGVDAVKVGRVQEYLDENPDAGINEIEREMIKYLVENPDPDAVNRPKTYVSKKTILRWLESGVVVRK